MTVYTQSNSLAWTKPTADADVIATIVGKPDRAVLFTYDAGDTLADGRTAVACRTGLFMNHAGTGKLTSVGTDLVAAAIAHTLSC